MLIDWFTVGAQVVNFLVLVWLMKRFLYKPILGAIDAREERIARELADGERMQAEAAREREEFERRKKALEDTRDELLETARNEARDERQKLLGQARVDAEAERARQGEALKRDRDCLLDEMARRTREETYAIARKTLSDLAGASFDERASLVFAQRVRSLDEPSRSDLIADAKSGPLRVRSAFELSEESRAAVRSALEDVLEGSAKVYFETDPDLIGGIEILTGNRKISWSIEEYLARMQKSMDELFSVSEAVAPADGGRDA
ncbi:MAG: F0F1 ATP synthase subunit B [Deltaproteobacteria bacterium HGW-Deltaproteobacteria-18]|nr:MAG: F0F1 ATP synthase subunit B [Deltaproteobacteria bacterium HGW-Deltaproteobacteria-18]